MIGLITYDRPHLKTQEIAERCKNKIDTILIIPFKERKARQVLFEHRPNQLEGPSPKELAKSIGAEILNLSDLKDTYKTQNNYLVVGGAGIIEKHYTSKHVIINSHPGLIPSSRGLDALKWAIYDKIAAGITIHQIDEDVDKGEIIHHELTSIYESDDLKSLANRHYRNEINTLANYINGAINKKVYRDIPVNESRMRMTMEKEKAMMRRFDEFKTYFTKHKTQ